jgi:serine/threonine protein phosphatase 1
MNFLKRFLSVAAAPTVPSGSRVYAIGDVHGCCGLLVSLLHNIEQDSARRAAARVQIVFLGDLIDRGPDSRGVVDCVMSLRSTHEVHVIKGNHEELFVAAARGDRTAARGLYGVGGRETLLSYGFSAEEIDAGSFGDLVELMGRRIPADHIEFLDCARDYLKIGDYVFVHAGLRPGVTLDQQCSQEMRWIRTEFTRSTRDHGGVVVHGHTVSEEVEMRPNRIGVDTGAYVSGRLSAIALQGAERWVITASAA